MTNKTYIKQRDLLIPEAERYANDKYGIQQVCPSLSAKTAPGIRQEWTRTFLLQMNKLAIAAGLCEEGSV